MTGVQTCALPILTGLYVSGNISTGAFFVGGGNAFSNLQSSQLVGNVANANVALVVSQSDQPNITSVGLLANLAVANTVTTGNLILNGLTSGFIQAHGTANVSSTAVIPIASGGTNQTSYATTKGVIYYDGTQFQAAPGITASTGSTLNVSSLNCSSLSTTSLIPSMTGIFMNQIGRAHV